MLFDNSFVDTLFNFLRAISLALRVRSDALAGHELQKLNWNLKARKGSS